MVPARVRFIHRSGFSEAVATVGFTFTIRFIMVGPVRKSHRAHWNWLLLLPALGLMFPGIYARTVPQLFGFPFFYWYQFAWVPFTSLIIGFVDWKVR